MNGLNFKERCGLTIAEIEYSDKYEELLEDGRDEQLLNKFNQAISILAIRAKSKESFDDFSFEEREVLEEVFSYIGDEHEKAN